MHKKAPNDPTKRPSKIKERESEIEQAAAEYRSPAQKSKFDEFREDRLDRKLKD